MSISTISTKIELESTLKCAEEFIEFNKDNENYVEDWLNIDFYREIFEGRYTRMKSFIYVDRTETLGFIVGSKFIPKIYEIRQHYVKNGYRGMGIATKLKNRLTDYAKDSGNLLIISDVLKNNIPSMRLNEKLNWTKKELDDETWRFIKRL